MLSTAKTDTFCSIFDRIGCVSRRICIGAYFQLTIFVRPLHNTSEVTAYRRFHCLDITLIDLTGGAEHMFFEPDRIPKIRQMILARTVEQREKALNALIPFQKGDFKALYEVMEGRPVTRSHPEKYNLPHGTLLRPVQIPCPLH